MKRNEENERKLLLYAIIFIIVILISIRFIYPQDHSIDDLIKMALGIFSGMGYFYFKKGKEELK